MDKDAREALEELVRNEKLAAIGRLASGIAHEINNPLTSASLAVELLKIKLSASGADPLIMEKLQTIEKSIDTASAIAKRLLALTRMDKAAFTKININSLIGDFLKSGDWPRFVTLQNKLDNEALEGIYIMGEEHSLRQALANVLNKSLQATSATGGTIGIETSCREGWITVEISDTGSGIAGSDIQRVFDPFFTTKELGEGLGLSVAYGIIRQHGGTIDVSSVPGEGAKVLITLPVMEGTCTKF
jgi:two-component system NtrC family sensor kinase